MVRPAWRDDEERRRGALSRAAEVAGGEAERTGVRTWGAAGGEGEGPGPVVKRWQSGDTGSRGFADLRPPCGGGGALGQGCAPPRGRGGFVPRSAGRRAGRSFGVRRGVERA